MTTKAKTDFRRVLHPGATEVYTGHTDYRRPGAEQGYQLVPLFLKIEYTDDGRLSITGVEGPRANGDAWGSCGQIVDTLDHLAELAPGWSADDVKRLREAWGRWHLNDMRAGCEHQRAAGWDKRPIDAGKPLNAYGRHFPGQQQDSWNMLTWVTRAEHAAGLLSEPCPTCGYKYGSEWLRENVPEDVLEFLRGLPPSDMTPAWV